MALALFSKSKVVPVLRQAVWFFKAMRQKLIHYTNIMLDNAHFPKQRDTHDVSEVGSPTVFR
jgi:hypothetical protein